MFWASRTQDYKKIQEKYLMIASLDPTVRFRFKIQLFYKRSVIEKSKLIKKINLAKFINFSINFIFHFN